MTRPRDYFWLQTARLLDKSIVGVAKPKEKIEQERRQWLKHEFCRLMSEVGE